MKSASFQKLIRYSFILLIFFFNTSRAQLFQLPKEWKFKLGDNIDWASQSFNDSGWDSKTIGASWSAKGIKDNVYAWYRVRIVIPSSIQNEVKKGNGIKLNLGKIDDVDQTYFNGMLIGQTGSLPPVYETKWNIERVYTVAENEIQWDKENVIAIRVFSPDIGGVGMYEGPYTFRPVQWSDFISIQHNIYGTDENGFITKVKFTNNSSHSFDGTIKYLVTDKAGKEILSETKPVQIQPEQGFEKIVTFSNYQPVNETVFNVAYRVTDNASTAFIKNEQLYFANPQIDIIIKDEPKPAIDNKIPDVFISIPFRDQVLKGYLGKRYTQNLEERLLKIDEKGMLEGYLQRPGNQPWVGEHAGKYLEAACNVWKNTHDSRLKKQMDRIMFELMNTQLENGYLGTYMPANYWTGWDVWSHKYNLYGLLAYYAATGYQPALETCKKMGDLLCATFGNDPGQKDIILAGEHQGMAATSILDPMVELYKYTGEKKYLDFCNYIMSAWEQTNGPKIISSLLSTGKVNKVANGKAYEMLSNLVGLIKLYRVTGEQKYLAPVLIAWKDIVSKRLYITGTTSSFEYFQDDGILPAAEKDHIGEGCVTTTWIQLNQNLLAVTGELKYFDEIEKSVYNHLLGAENPETGCVSYYTPLMDKKPYSCDISCCTSSVPRGIAMIPFFTFANIKNVPTLMMYEPASYKENIKTTDNKNINLAIQVESNFPENGFSVIAVNPSQASSFAIALRVPSWCSFFTATVAGTKYKSTSNQYLLINRSWKTGDKIQVSFKMPIEIIKGGKNYKGLVALKRGPQVLAFDSLLNAGLLKRYPYALTADMFAAMPEMKTNTSFLPAGWIGKQAYSINTTNKINNPGSQQILLVPFADASQTGGVVKVWMPLSITVK